MKTLKATTGIENNIKKIMTNRVIELSDLEQLITEDHARVTRATEEVERAIETGELEVYQKAKSMLANAKDSEEMHQYRRDTLADKPLITDKDYTDAVNSIVAEIKSIEEAAARKLLKLTDEMIETAAILEEQTAYANKVLARLQHEVYRDKDRTRNNKGDILIINHETKAVDTYETIRWGKLAITNEKYKQTAAALEQTDEE